MPLTPDGIDQLLKEFLEYMLTFGKQYFFMHTDRAAHDQLHRDTGVQDPPNPLDADARRKLVAAAGSVCGARKGGEGGPSPPLLTWPRSEPEHVGCQELRALLEDEDGFKVRKNVTKAVIQSFLGIYYNPFDKYRERLLCDRCIRFVPPARLPTPRPPPPPPTHLPDTLSTTASTPKPRP